MSFESENVTRLYVENEDSGCLELRPSPDAPDFGIILHTPDEKSEKWFGKVNLLMDASECRTLGEEMIKYANAFDEKNA